MSAPRFKVWTPRPVWFATLEEARDYAEIYFLKMGVIVAVEEVSR